MVDTGDPAPDFTLPKAGGDGYDDVEAFTLSAALGDGPLVLAFVPAAFTSGCTEELCTFRDSIGAFQAVDAQVYGVSVDLPFAQNVWIQQEALTFPLLSDWNHEVIHAYDVVLEDMYGSMEVAERSVFVIDAEGTVTYRWVREEANPDFDRLVSEISDAVERTAET